MNLADFNAARAAGLTPIRAARYAIHCDRRRAAGLPPLTPTEAAAAPRTRR